MPSIYSYVSEFHKLVCQEIAEAVRELREKGVEAYPPVQITYNYDDKDEITLQYYMSEDNDRNT